MSAATRTGYTFNGWYTASSGGTRVGGEKDSYTPTANITLYAQWTVNQYTLTIDPNSGTWKGSTDTQTVKQDYGTTYTIENPTRTGYTFKGWTLTGGGDLNESTYTFGTSNGTVKANWEVNTYHVSFNGTNYVEYPITTVTAYLTTIEQSYEYVNNEQIAHVKIKTTQKSEGSGFYKHFYSLTIGETYYWTVDLKCSSNRVTNHCHIEKCGSKMTDLTTEWQTIYSNEN